mgnify:CR=1 FL=1
MSANATVVAGGSAVGSARSVGSVGAFTLRLAGGDAKVAIVSLLADIGSEQARERLDSVNGVVRKALEQ